jgi:hypothetical protein
LQVSSDARGAQGIGGRDGLGRDRSGGHNLGTAFCAEIDFAENWTTACLTDHPIPPARLSSALSITWLRRLVRVGSVGGFDASDFSLRGDQRRTSLACACWM